MRYSLIIGAVLLLGIGEYVVVELAPLNKQQRTERIERLPVVKYIAHFEQYRLIKEAFKHNDGHVVIWHGQDFRTTEWSSASDLFDAFVRGHLVAQIKVKQLMDAAENRKHLPADREAALQGSTWHRIHYALRSLDTYDENIRTHALSLLEADSTAAAAFYRESIDSEWPLDFESSKTIVLWTLFVLEDLHHPQDTAEAAHRHDDLLRDRLTEFVERAEEGIPAATEALSQLSSEHGIDLPHIVANWESIRNHHPLS